MNRNSLTRIALLTAFAVVASGLAIPLRAEVVPIFNTGVDGSGNVVPNGTTPDIHYALVSAPVGATTTLAVMTSAGGFPIPPWLGDDSLSAWIGPDVTVANGPAGNYDYQTTFNLTGLDPTTAFLTGQWSSDNAGVDILLNGASTGNSIAVGSGTIADPYSFAAWHQFTIAGGFGDGVNTLDFIVNNLDNGGVNPNPTGLRVEITQLTADVATPEPSTSALAGTALLILFLSMRRKRIRPLSNGESK